MYRFGVVVGLALVLCVLAGCGLGETPEGGARAYLDAQLGANQSQLLERTCTRLHGQLAAMQNLSNLFGIPSQTTQADTSQLNFTTTGQSGSSAFVRISGTIRIGGANGTTLPFDLTLPMSYEDNRWKVCG